MSYMKIGNTCIRENGRKVNIFTVVDRIKKDLKAVIPEVEDDKLIFIMSHCRSYLRIPLLQMCISGFCFHIHAWLKLQASNGTLHRKKR